MVVMPVAWDQPDHAARVERLGVARVIGRRWYRARRVAREVGRVLEDAGYGERARAVGEVVRREDGVGVACGAIEGVLGKGRGGGS
jgi:UDP:flavonoid glycosyltransferase YjiC (YdhE family)